MAKQQLWGGRFKQGLDDHAIDFSYSLDFDQVLLPYDVAVNKVQSLALAKAGVISAEECDQIQHSLDGILERADDILSEDHSDEDIHSLVERLVI